MNFSLLSSTLVRFNKGDFITIVIVKKQLNLSYLVKRKIYIFEYEKNMIGKVKENIQKLF